MKKKKHKHTHTKAKAILALKIVRFLGPIHQRDESRKKWRAEL